MAKNRLFAHDIFAFFKLTVFLSGIISNRVDIELFDSFYFGKGSIARYGHERNLVCLSALVTRDQRLEVVVESLVSFVVFALLHSNAVQNRPLIGLKDRRRIAGSLVSTEEVVFDTLFANIFENLVLRALVIIMSVVFDSNSTQIGVLFQEMSRFALCALQSRVSGEVVVGKEHFLVDFFELCVDIENLAVLISSIRDASIELISKGL